MLVVDPNIEWKDVFLQYPAAAPLRRIAERSGSYMVFAGLEGLVFSIAWRHISDPPCRRRDRGSGYRRTRATSLFAEKMSLSHG